VYILAQIVQAITRQLGCNVAINEELLFNCSDSFKISFKFSVAASSQSVQLINFVNNKQRHRLDNAFTKIYRREAV